MAKKINSLIIAMDNGFANMKIKGADKEIIYSNNYQRGQVDPSFLNEFTHNVYHNDVEFVIGDKARNAGGLEGKASETSVLCALVGLTHFCQPSTTEKVENRIFLMYGESVDKYFNISQRKKITEALQKKHEIVVDSLTYILDIELVHILPEGVGYIFSNMEERGGTQHIVDMGGTTINFLTVNDGIVDEEKSRSFTLGKHNLVEKLTRNLKRNTEIGDIDNKMASNYLEKGHSDKYISQEIEKTIFEQFDELDSNLSPIGIGINNLLNHKDVIFLGGTSTLLADYIRKFYKAEIGGRVATVLGNKSDQEALFATVRGFYQLGVALHSDKLNA